jgi:hypothetical protein
LALSGTERHLRPKLDQGRDQETKPIFGLEAAAERLLRAVAEGRPESVELARELVGAVLKDAIVQRAVQLDLLLREQSPLALVRAVELAESVLQVRELATTRAIR